MLSVRALACATATAGAMVCFAVVAAAGDILLAIWAMKVPSPIRMAAKIIRLRMTPYSENRTRNFTTPAAPPRARAGARACHFGEKDERRVNASPLRRPNVIGRLARTDFAAPQAVFQAVLATG